MVVTLSQQLRDASGDFACPALECWREHKTRVRPSDAVCPKCGVELEWPEDSIAVHQHYKPFQVLCSDCFDREPVGTRFCAVRPQFICTKCGRECLGYEVDRPLT